MSLSALHPQIISEQKAWDTYHLYDYFSVDYFTFYKCNYLLLDGDLHIDDDFDMDILYTQIDPALNGLVINGNLTVTGTLKFAYPLILVLGNVQASHLFVGNGAAHITSNCIIKGVIYGESNHGRFTVNSQIKARFLIYKTEQVSFGSIDIGTISIDNDFNSGCRNEYTYYWHELKSIFLQPLWCLNHNSEFEALDINLLTQYIDTEQPVMQTGAKPQREKIEEEIELLAKSGDPVTNLNLSENHLLAIPSHLFQIHSLQKLDLSYNLIRIIPPIFAALSNLEDLDLSSNKLDSLPDEVAGLKKLKQLTLRRNLFSSSEQERIAKLLPYTNIIF